MTRNNPETCPHPDKDLDRIGSDIIVCLACLSEHSISETWETKRLVWKSPAKAGGEGTENE